MRIALLFPGLDTGFRWALCPRGETWGEDAEGQLSTICPFHKEPLRPLTWADLDDAVKPGQAPEP